MAAPVLLTLILAGARLGVPDGAAIYAGKGNCATCHGRTGTGTWLHIDGSADSIAALVRRGVPEPLEASVAMPPRGGARLSDLEVAAVARYVYELSH